MQTTDPKNSPEDVELRVRALRTLWFALSMSIVLYYALTYMVRTPSANANPTLSLVLLVVAVLSALVAFVIKGKLLNHAFERRRLRLVQQAYIVTWAITEVAALLGLVDYFATGNRYFFVLFLIAAGGMLFHFPRRQHVLNAAFNSSAF